MSKNKIDDEVKVESNVAVAWTLRAVHDPVRVYEAEVRQLKPVPSLSTSVYVLVRIVEGALETDGKQRWSVSIWTRGAGWVSLFDVVSAPDVGVIRALAEPYLVALTASRTWGVS